MRLWSAQDWARLSWHQRNRLHAARLALVARLEEAHRELYPDAHKPFCSEAGCRRKSRAYGWCELHYRRWRRKAGYAS